MERREDGATRRVIDAESVSERSTILTKPDGGRSGARTTGGF